MTSALHRCRDGSACGDCRSCRRHSQVRRRRGRNAPYAQERQGLGSEGSYPGGQPDEGPIGHRTGRTSRNAGRPDCHRHWLKSPFRAGHPVSGEVQFPVSLLRLPYGLIGDTRPSRATPSLGNVLGFSWASAGPCPCPGRASANRSGRTVSYSAAGLGFVHTN